ncbi:iron ABC transporter permease [Nitratireductor aquimarinus]|uniref:ABC transporter permease n=1 Tax=Nitratireductor TaxID=245876 RepID=UPI0019D32DF2|nr:MULTISPECIES: iron ABC transporter permease [Nitratireductor]MBN7778502.1 iron ABC transporter permease [Nitratireductor pacificus]MBN7782824.1 iron ABC transporter permease [Nitratireductor pacificus]MBN7791631.1 iron ABC transporter permease [Nitratireductor aquimarinus]MBY6100889.1 iron ABC transporter permease [Nitratireductor aquimarinus]MCA1260833.1 iron ABC transporter permease [Nitratireductor aquimarinus]
MGFSFGSPSRTALSSIAPFGAGSSWRYWLKARALDLSTLLALGLLILFSYLIAGPVFLLLGDAFQVQFAEQMRVGLPHGSFTTYYFERALFSAVAQDIFWIPLFNTLSIAVGAIAVALAVGAPLGWLLSRTDLPGKRWLSIALIVPYMLPSWTFALAWSTLFKNRTTGGAPSWLESFGFSPPDWLAYGQFPITLILALHYAPFVILLFGNALRQFDSQLEDAARIMGAGRLHVARRIVLPLMLPSLVSACTLIFAKCLGDFGVAYVLGVPVRYDVLATSLFRAISTSQTGMSAVLAGTIVLLGAISILIDMWLLREVSRFQTIGSKGSMARLAHLGRFAPWATSWAVLVLLVSAIIPLTALTLTTVMKMPGVFTWDNFTLDFWIGSDLTTTALRQGILLTPDFWWATFNTIWIVGTAALGAGFLGLLVGIAVARSPVKIAGSLLRYLTFLPYLVPGIAFAAAYLSMFAVPRGPVPALYGTSIILVLAILADQMPFASRAGISAMMQLGKDPEDAARIVGAGWWRRLLSIVVPIQKGALVSGVLLPFISGIKGLSLVVVLAVPGTDLLTTYAIRLVDYGYTQASNAVVLMLCVIAFFGTLGVQRLTKSSLSDGLGSK